MTIPILEGPYSDPLPGLPPTPSGAPFHGPDVFPEETPAEPREPEPPLRQIPPGDAPREGLWL